MKDILFASLCLVFLIGSTELSAQRFYRLPMSFSANGENLANPLAGGLNNPQFSEVDLNNDGIQDLFVFDRSGDVSLSFLNLNIPNQTNYTFAPEYALNFPSLGHWALLRDFDQDGAVDIFTSARANGGVVQGFYVYKGFFTADNVLSFEQFNFYETPNNVIPVPSLNGNFTQLYVSAEDIPAVDDVDGDGDLDILTFSESGGYLYWFKNESVEKGFGLDSLKFRRADDCWGKFFELKTSEDLVLSDNANDCALGLHNPVEYRHAGSTVMSFDQDGDGDKEILLGDISSLRLNYLKNTGDNENAYVTEQDASFPSYNTPIVIVDFVAGFYLDVNNDGKKDLIASPNDDGSAIDYEVAWYYKNVGTDDNVLFELERKDFMVDEMVDLGSGSHPTFVDYNADGLLDLVVGTFGYYQVGGLFDPRLFLFENVGTPTAPKFDLVDDDYLNFSQFGNLSWDFAPNFGDLDNDGDLDLLVGEEYGSLYFVENTAGAGNPLSFGSIVANYKDINIGQKSVPYIVDVNRDGLADIVVGELVGNNDTNGEACSSLTYFQNVGSSNNPDFISDDTTAPNDKCFGQLLTNNGSGKSYSSPVLVDFMGAYQLFSASRNGKIQQYDNIDGNLDGAFNLVTSNFGQIREGVGTHMAIADLNGDNQYDIIVGNKRGGLGAYITNLFTDGSVSTVTPQAIVSASIFPNPASTNIWISLEKQGSTAAVYQISNAVGQQVATGTFSTSHHSVAIGHLAKGIYFCQIQLGNERVTKKFIKR
ncbi:MAG: T9SS type A sorting domain-containing protein [Saprospiraceae bacterium]